MRNEPRAKTSCLLMSLGALVLLAIIAWLAFGGGVRAPQPTAASPDQPNEELQPGAAPPT